jgi:hypothetical protein
MGAFARNWLAMALPHDIFGGDWSALSTSLGALASMAFSSPTGGVLGCAMVIDRCHISEWRRVS